MSDGLKLGERAKDKLLNVEGVLTKRIEDAAGGISFEFSAIGEAGWYRKPSILPEARLAALGPVRAS